MADSMCNLANKGKLQTHQNQQGRSHKEHKTHLKKKTPYW
jgi:hypothetical protein